MNNPVALITGSAKRIGAAIARHLHLHNFNIVLHYHESETEANQLANDLNTLRNNSAVAFKANLDDMQGLKKLANDAVKHWRRLDVLINNASSFYPTPIETALENDWDKLISSNLKAPFFLTQTLAFELKKQNGCVINIADIYADRPLKNHSIYSIGKAGNVMLTKSLAIELAPEIRVN